MVNIQIKISNIAGKAALFFLTLQYPLSKVSELMATAGDKPAFGCLLAAEIDYNMIGEL